MGQQAGHSYEPEENDEASCSLRSGIEQQRVDVDKATTKISEVCGCACDIVASRPLMA